VAEVGYLPVELDADDALLGALGPRVVPFVSHADEVLPAPGIQVLGRSAACAVHALRLPGRPAWGVQFHLEYPREEQERVLTYRAARHPELGLDPRQAALAPDLEPQATALFQRFQALVDVWEGVSPG
jgi:GMP synthase-like glutamine amidotransferase